MDVKKAAKAHEASVDSPCILSNFTREKSVRISLEIADSEMSRTRGLMFRKKVVPILFEFGREGIYPIHSFFVPSFFEAIYLSEDGKVTEAFFRIPPGKPFICPKKTARFLLELPPQISRKLRISEGDILKWKFVRKRNRKRKKG